MRVRLSPNKGVCDLCGSDKTTIRDGVSGWLHNPDPINNEQIICVNCYARMQRRYNPKIKEYQRRYMKEWNLKNRERDLAKRRERYRMFTEKMKSQSKNYRSKFSIILNAKQRERIKAFKFQVINHYSNGTMQCDCCGETRYEFLSIDHINGGGTKHRKQVTVLWRWLVRNNFPDGFRILCFNCNCALGIYGYCPHRHQESVQESLPILIRRG